jgi:hypothetical protein
LSVKGLAGRFGKLVTERVDYGNGKSRALNSRARPAPGLCCLPDRFAYKEAIRG